MEPIITYHNNAGTVNPIGWLQELCIEKKIALPEYIDRTPENRVPGKFFCECRLERNRTVGYGTTKRVAKFYAALNMLKRVDPNGKLKRFTKGDPLRPIEDYYPPQACVSQQRPFKAGDGNPFRRRIGKRGNENELAAANCAAPATALESLGEGFCEQTDYVEELRDAARKGRFEIEYMESKSKTPANQFQCLLQLGILPNIVTHGCGESMPEAKNQAAAQALVAIQYYLGDN